MNNFGFDESREKERAEYWKQYLLSHQTTEMTLMKNYGYDSMGFLKTRKTDKDGFTGISGISGI
jgi:hypothetical protein